MGPIFKPFDPEKWMDELPVYPNFEPSPNACSVEAISSADEKEPLETPAEQNSEKVNIEKKTVENVVQKVTVEKVVHKAVEKVVQKAVEKVLEKATVENVVEKPMEKAIENNNEKTTDDATIDLISSEDEIPETLPEVESSANIPRVVGPCLAPSETPWFVVAAANASAEEPAVHASLQHNRRLRGKSRATAKAPTADELLASATAKAPTAMCEKQVQSVAEKPAKRKKPNPKPSKPAEPAEKAHQAFRMTCQMERDQMIFRVMTKSPTGQQVAVVCNGENLFKGCDRAKQFSLWCLKMARQGADKSDIAAAKSAVLKCGQCDVAGDTFSF